MTTYYTVDANGTFVGGRPILLESSAWALAKMHIRVPDDLGREPAGVADAGRARAREVFPHGLSLHGISLVNPIYRQDPRKCEFERLAEGVRQREAPHAPSRLACIFAMDDLRTARAWMQNRVGAGYLKSRVWEVEAAHSPAFDMMMLGTTADSWEKLSVIARAHRYWAGERTAKPFMERLLTPPVTPIKVVASDRGALDIAEGG